MNIFQLIFIVFTTLLLLFVGFKFYIKYSRQFCVSRRRLDGLVAIVTGGNTGIGFETARNLAKRGAKVILACRDLKKADVAAGIISKETRNRNVIVRKLDLGSMASVRNFCNQVVKEETRLDILVNNAAVAYATKVAVITEDGFEGHLATNHLGPFLLTNMLLGLMLKSGQSSRIINVSSDTHKHIKSIDLENLNSEKIYEPRSIYMKTKLYNILFTIELSKRIQSAGLQNKLTVNCLHPGIIKTEIFRHAKKSRLYRVILAILETLFLTVWEGAQTSINLAVSEEMNGISGLYWVNCKNAKTSNLAEDDVLAKELWERTVKFVKLQPNEYHLPK